MGSSPSPGTPGEGRSEGQSNITNPKSKIGSLVASLLLVLSLALLGCDNLYDQARYDPEEPSEFFPNGTSARPIPPGTVARGQARTDELLHQGTLNGQPAEQFPFPITLDDLRRGQQRYNIFCSPCHGASGYGDGMIVRRGLTPPPSFHLQRLRQAPVGHYFDVITNGWGAMYSYNARVPVADRWRIIAYIRALQLSQNVPVAQLSAEDLQRFQAPGAPTTQQAPGQQPPATMPPTTQPGGNTP